MFIVTPEHRTNNIAGLDTPVEFGTWPEVKAATTAYLSRHTDASEVFFSIQKKGEGNELYVGFFRTTNGWRREESWYGDDNTHQCVVQETPDGMGCVTCLYV